VPESTHLIRISGHLADEQREKSHGSPIRDESSNALSYRGGATMAHDLAAATAPSLSGGLLLCRTVLCLHGKRGERILMDAKRGAPPCSLTDPP
jgi:hypothetical protein